MKTFDKPTRVWVNQPSTLQPNHKLHGKVVIAWTDKDGFTNIYFVKGDTYSMRIDPNCLETKNSNDNVFGFSSTGGKLPWETEITDGMRCGLSEVEFTERELLFELQRSKTRWLSQEEFDRLKELSNKMFANASWPNCA